MDLNFLYFILLINNCILLTLKDLTHWVAGWVDWNIVLDETGGPNYVHDNVDSPVIVNTASMSNLHD